MLPTAAAPYRCCAAQRKQCEADEISDDDEKKWIRRPCKVALKQGETADDNSKRNASIMMTSPLFQEAWSDPIHVGLWLGNYAAAIRMNKCSSRLANYVGRVFLGCLGMFPLVH